SANIGRDVYLPVGNTWHHARLSTVHVGRSGRGRKNEALSLVHRIEHEIDPLLLGQTHYGGLSTREGLALLIHDGFKDGREEIPQATDEAMVKALAQKTQEVIKFAKGKYPAKKNSRPMSLAPSAASLYKELYRGELNRYEDGELLAALLERRAPVLLRLAMLF